MQPPKAPAQPSWQEPPTGRHRSNMSNSVMGGEPSKVEEPPMEPWREINWRDNQSTLQYVQNYKPQTVGQQLRILLHGPVGAGKSSFINSVHSVLNGRMYAQALVDNVSHDSFTKQYTTYQIPKRGPETFYPFVFNDVMGLDPRGVALVEDIKLAMMGHVKEDYRFSPTSALSDDNTHHFYNNNPTDNDKVHVLVCVVPANTVSQMRAETVQKIRKIRIEASKLRIPQVAILTKIDEACPELKNNLKKVYRTKYLKEKMEEFSAAVGIPMNCIFPVKNYHSEIDLNSDVDSLILSALNNIINFGDDCINFHKNRPECSNTKSISMSRLQDL
ncbi:interferon-induced protein 44-like [Epinephelus moara]|uniref:interferon-induced protein 44-like n=1 Tax=Epinephelus moara TaxID=300413 RepID=UPI00214E808A|nr:interferon-induced protein 44-like [Epinephelus moara]